MNCRPLSCLYTCLLCILVSAPAFAGEWQFDANYHFNKTSVSTSNEEPEFTLNGAASFNANYLLNRWVAFEAGLYGNSAADSEEQRDIAGGYKVTLQSKALTLGIKPQWRVNDIHGIGLRLGLLAYDTEMEVEEYFSGDIEPGTQKADDTGMGYYLTFTWQYWYNDHWAFNTQLSHHTMLDVFKDKTDNDQSFDINNNALSLGVIYQL